MLSLFLQKRQDITFSALHNYQRVAALQSPIQGGSCQDHSYAASEWTDAQDGGIPISRRLWVCAIWKRLIELQWFRPCLVCHNTGQPRYQSAYNRAGLLLRTQFTAICTQLQEFDAMSCEDARDNIVGWVMKAKCNGRVIIYGKKSIMAGPWQKASCGNYAHQQQNHQV